MSNYQKHRRDQAKATVAKTDGVHYLRVSSVRQTHTGSDVDKDGNSIATQREECDQKASALGVPVIEQFVEPGKSARTITKRPEFRRLLAYLAEHPNVGYVFIYARSRAFRNTYDAVVTEQYLKELGVRLISVKEDFADDPNGRFAKFVMDASNEMQNDNSGLDIRRKMEHKAKNGGTIGPAPIGYLNARIDVDGRQVNSVIIDEVRAPLVRLAFELYASGEYSLEALQETMEDHGLRAKPSNRWPASRPLAINTLHKLLGDPYYAGYTIYEGQSYDGRHAALVNQVLFDRVQEVIEMRSSRGIRDRVLWHYLKGMLRCDRCRQQERISRLIYTEAKGNGGTYGYYLCRGRQDGVCDLPYLPVGQVEQKVIDFFGKIRLTSTYVDEFAASLDHALASHQRSSRELHAHLNKELDRLAEQEDRLLDALMDAELPQAKIRERLNDVRRRRKRVLERTVDANRDLQVGANVLKTSIALAHDAHRLYSEATDEARAQICRAYFQAIYLDEKGNVTDAQFTEPFVAVHDTHRAWLAIGQEGEAAESQGSQIREKRPDRLTEALLRIQPPNSGHTHLVDGSSTAVLVDVKGLEPLTPRV